MWFGDERGYNATRTTISNGKAKLWFGDERGYNATISKRICIPTTLWFGDERGYNATQFQGKRGSDRCGLVMKEDITQPWSEQDGRCCVVVWGYNATSNKARNRSVKLWFGDERGYNATKEVSPEP